VANSVIPQMAALKPLRPLTTLNSPTPVDPIHFAEVARRWRGSRRHHLAHVRSRRLSRRRRIPQDRSEWPWAVLAQTLPLRCSKCLSALCEIIW